MALLLAQARNIPQANEALKAGRWEKSKWEGVELSGKTLGLIGIGRIGTLVAQRAHAFGMRILAWDPWVTPDRARQLGVELADLDSLVGQADFLTIHLAMVKEYVGIVNDELLAKAKPGIRIVNAARGGLIDAAALERALKAGIVAGAAIDVFEVEPCTDSPLFAFDRVVVTPHLASSTPEAQDKAGAMIAEQVVLALSGEFVPFAINVEATEAAEAVRPYLPLAERLGRLFGNLNEGTPAVLEVTYQGGLADHDTRILTLAVLKGLFGVGAEEPVSYVNAPQLAEDRGLEVRETKSSMAHDYDNLIT
jgi:D-3-phosphoglycerate dehydrogenase